MGTDPGFYDHVLKELFHPLGTLAIGQVSRFLALSFETD